MTRQKDDDAAPSGRVDRWLWTVRICKTRSEATSVCAGGHVRVNGNVAKPASQVAAGDRVQLRMRGADRVVEVVEVLGARVGPAIAAGCYIDHTPPPPHGGAEAADAGARRAPGSGRPTKRERRQLDRWRSDR